MDFLKIKSFTIPEGKVKSISIGGVKVWTEQNELPETPYQLSGTWLWNISPKPIWEGQSPLYVQGVSQTINFTSNNKNYTKIYSNPFSMSTKGYMNYDDDIVYFWDDSNYWVRSEYRTITFTTPQAVSERFYTWFTANATYMLDGTWLFNEMLSFPLENSNTTWETQDIYFKANVHSYNQFVFTQTGDREGSLGYKSVGTSNYYFWRYDSETDTAKDFWYNKKFRTVTFDKPQTVSEKFCAWFTANATKQN